MPGHIEIRKEYRTKSALIAIIIGAIGLGSLIIFINNFFDDSLFRLIIFFLIGATFSLIILAGIETYLRGTRFVKETIDYDDKGMTFSVSSPIPIPWFNAIRQVKYAEIERIEFSSQATYVPPEVGSKDVFGVVVKEQGSGLKVGYIDTKLEKNLADGAKNLLMQNAVKLIIIPKGGSNHEKVNMAGLKLKVPYYSYWIPKDDADAMKKDPNILQKINAVFQQ
jgi:hypothetical protein